MLIPWATSPVQNQNTRRGINPQIGNAPDRARKFTLTLKENARGRFLRITEDPDGRRDTVIIPSTGLEDFRRILNEILQPSPVSHP